MKKPHRSLLARPAETELLGPSFELYPTGLTVKGQPTIQQYDEAFTRLSLIESAQSWWWGDLANAREKDYGSLTTRVDSLSFRHHQIAAPIIAASSINHKTFPLILGALLLCVSGFAHQTTTTKFLSPVPQTTVAYHIL